MIPIKLFLRNFMCYRENVPPLVFTGIHTACICGDNGNGKSALIDAMTWALWGKARAKSDIDLIAQGQSEMSVEFDFSIGNQLYRIVRKYARPKTRTGSGHPLLEFQAAVNSGFRPISGNNVTQTQQKISDTLHMDYDTFVNSAFLRQGHADEFTKQPPSKRKDVLATILGLSQYDDLEAKSKDSMKIWEELTGNLQVAVKEIDDELAQKTQIEEELSRAQQELAVIEQNAIRQEGSLNELRKKHEVMEAKKSQLAQMEQYLGATRQSISEWSEQLNRHLAQQLIYEGLIAQKAAIEEGFDRFLVVKKSYDELNQKLSLLVRFNERKNKLEMAVEKARSTLLTEHAVAQRSIGDLNTKTASLASLKNEMQQLDSQQAKISSSEAAMDEKRQINQESHSNTGKLEASLLQVQSQLKELDSKLALLHTETETRCPLCEQPLGIPERQHIDNKYNTEKSEKQALLQSFQKQLAASKMELLKSDKEVSLLEQKMKQDRASLQGKLSVVHKGMSDVAEAAVALKNEQSKLNEIEQRLAGHDYALSETQALTAIENEIAALNYNQELHETVRQQMSELVKFEEPKRKLEEAARMISSEREAIERATKTLTTLSDSLHNYTTQQQQLAGDITALPQLAADLAAAQTAYDKIISNSKIAGEKVGRAKEKLARCAELEIKRKEKENQAARALEQTKIYQELAQAFGKKGIQALLIEIAIPEIQEEADHLLARMTDNRMHIAIETQRETKKGDVAETLDINVSDELGTRNYEMYSGGEAFRINFAIRIALSRLLARRAGAPLPTLIIDEGFGTQDNTGIEKLKEAITSIKNDFEKILVITHIDDLKDAFPARIEVTKTAEGSTVEVN
jgi:DNA repair protein SbcC/Rad50